MRRCRPELEPAIGVFEQLDDRAGLGRALSIAGMLRLWRGEAAGAIEELERAARFAREAGDRPQEIQNLHFVLIALLCRLDAVRAGLEQLDEIQPSSRRRLQSGMSFCGHAPTSKRCRELRHGSRLLVEAKALAENSVTRAQQRAPVKSRCSPVTFQPRSMGFELPARRSSGGKTGATSQAWRHSLPMHCTHRGGEVKPRR